MQMYISRCIFIGNLDIFPLISISDIVSISKLITDKSNNISFEGLDIHYH